MSGVCPKCRRPTPPGFGTCGEHGLCGLERDVLGKLDDAPLLGHVLDGRYALVDVIGGGGMGMVYRAVQLPIERPVAVKVLHAGLTLARADRARFEREARAMSALKSNHTVTLFDFGVVREGPLANLAFMAMELVEGESLASKLRRGKLAAARVAALLDAVAHSLSEAHGLGIVHRDLKPDNILLTRGHDRRELVKVIDFGIARLEGSTHTASGAIIGTPQYMAPEQCRGAGHGVLDARVDVYAMGIVCYEALTGERPFDGAQPVAVLVKQMNAEPPSLPGSESDATLAALESVLLRALAKAPEERFQSITELANAFAAAAGVERPPLEVPEALERWTDAAELVTPRQMIAPGDAVAAGEARTDADADAIRPDTFHESTGQLPTSDLRPASPRRWLVASAPLLFGALAAAIYWVSTGTSEQGRAGDRVVVTALPVDAAAAPISTTPIDARAPVTERDAGLPPSADAFAPDAAAPESAAMAGKADPPARRRPARTPARPSRAGPRTMNPRSASLAAAAQTALASCRCEEARQAIDSLQGLGLATPLLGSLTARLARCKPATTDEICIDGILRPR